MKIVHISDTHGYHDHVKVSPCDVLVHSGDCTNDAGRASLRSFLTWFERQPAKNKILVAGNHDWAFQKWPELARAMVAEAAPSVAYLEDSGVSIDGINFWGSPYQPEFCNWAFNLPRGPELKRHWDMIPNSTDVLITHGPAYGLRDKSGFGGELCGCKDLYDALLRVHPAYHLFGHIHHSYGEVTLDLGLGQRIKCLNSSICNEAYNPVNAPHEFEISIATEKVGDGG